MRSLFSVLNGSALPFVALNGSTGLVMYGGQLLTTGPGYQGNGNHLSLTALNGQVFLSSVTWSPGSVAKATADCYFRSTAGGTDPVTAASNANLPTLSVNTEQLVLSALTLGGSSVTRVANLSININHQCENNDEAICYNTGLPHPILLKEAGVGGQTEISATVETLDLTTSFSAGSLVATFTALSNTGVGLASNTATITLSNCVVRTRDIPGQQGGPGVRAMDIRATYDGITQPVTVAVA
jgi:hypothetical protein